MQPKILDSEIQQAARLLQAGKLVAFPTETVYGLGADATNPHAVRQIFAAKGRPADHPVIVHLADSSQLGNWTRNLSPIAERLAQAFWPGPMTLILPRATGVLDLITGGQDTVGLRIPRHPVAQALLRAFGGGIAAPSANRFGRISPTQAEHVSKELDGAVAMILDGGACSVGIESTIIDVTAAHPRILRPGAISAEQISQIAGFPIAIAQAGSPAELRAPGLLLAHYAPQTPLQIMNITSLMGRINTEPARITVLALHPAPALPPNIQWVTMPDQAPAYAHDLYSQLRRADENQQALILVEQVPSTADWVAIHDRLSKAAHCYNLSL